MEGVKKDMNKMGVQDILSLEISGRINIVVVDYRASTPSSLTGSILWDKGFVVAVIILFLLSFSRSLTNFLKAKFFFPSAFPLKESSN